MPIRFKNERAQHAHADHATRVISVQRWLRRATSLMYSVIGDELILYQLVQHRAGAHIHTHIILTYTQRYHLNLASYTGFRPRADNVSAGTGFALVQAAAPSRPPSLALNKLRAHLHTPSPSPLCSTHSVFQLRHSNTDHESECVLCVWVR